jgi:hypothetical protein
MSHRYAVLWESTDRGSRPVGLALERDDFVLVEVRADLDIPTRYEEPIEVRGSDMAVVEHRPGDAAYFDHVLIELSRAFIIVDQGTVIHTYW